MSTNQPAAAIEAATTHIATGEAGGKHITGAPLTTDMAQVAAPTLMMNAIDRAVVKIRPMATPLDQISRMGHVRPVDALEVDYYSVDTRADKAEVMSAVPDSTGDDEEHPMAKIMLSDASCFEPSDTFLLEIEGGKNVAGYVVAKTDNTLQCILAEKGATLDDAVRMIRMGRAATQLDVQSPQFGVLPQKRTNLCQIFKMQIEQSMVMKMSHKEIGWDFTDQQEAAVYDMRLGMEKQFLFGKKVKIFDPVKGETVTMTEGIWNQAGKTVNIDVKALDTNALIDMLRTVFTENSGSRRKVLIAGSELIAALNKIENTRVITAQQQVTSWGVDFTELCSKFGKLYTVFSDVFDSMGMPCNGIVVDPEYIQKHVFIPFMAEKLDLRGSGQRNTEAMVLTEASCLTLRYPEAHARIIGQ